jgi:bifunctional enzyme CysN/CysC
MDHEIEPQETLSNEAFQAYLTAQESKSFLRFLTCGSVDDGKSTLIGRLLFDTKLLFEDQLAALEKDSKKHGTVGEEIDLALLVDGLQAEREQGITIDVAYRFFATDRRKFIVADTPGHEQYTRNMATGASNSELAVILIDARHGILPQTRRHSFIVSLLGIKHVVVAINKIDLVDYSENKFNEIVAEYEQLTSDFGFETRQAIPMSARFGDNVIHRSGQTDWYNGPTLLTHLEQVNVETDLRQQPFRMPVQWVNRPNLDFRGFSGTIASGQIAPGQSIAVANSGKSSTIKSIVTYDGEIDAADANDAVTITLTDEIDVSRGDVLCSADDRPEVADQFSAKIIWMNEEALFPGRMYQLKIGANTVNVQITEIKYQTDINSFEHIASKQLELNEVGECNLSLSEPIAFDPFPENRATGGFILIDRFTNQTVGAGMITHGLRRATNVHWQSLDVDKSTRATAKHQKPVVAWFTGLSGSGKSTIANFVEKRLHAENRHTYILDGDNVRHGLNRDLGFTEADRVENIRRVGEVAKLFVDSGLITLVSFISPYRSERQMARELLEDDEFIEIFVSTPLETAEARDPKGLYKRARAGDIKNFTGIDSPYEAPENADLVLDTTAKSASELADDVVLYLRERGYLG